MRRTGFATLGMILVALAWASPARAQLSLGVAAGATYSSMGGTLITSTDSDWGALMGGWGNYRLESNLAFQFEANWVQKGGRGTVEGIRDDFDLDYVELPLTAQLVVGLSPTWDWNLYGGIALAFQTSCQVSQNEGAKEDCEQAEPTWSFASTEWSVPFGTSFSYRFSRSALTADFRYSYGLSDAIENLRLRNRSWQFILRWGFGV
ncbi:MAG: PorT family protein [marine benthic group bacterium]|nr:PorT family protein [Candidatus Benthicola marisminoris]